MIIFLCRAGAVLKPLKRVERKRINAASPQKYRAVKLSVHCAQNLKILASS